MNNQTVTEKVISCLDKPTSVTQLAKKLKMNKMKLMGILSTLEEQGEVERFKVGRAYVFQKKGG